MKFTKEFKLEMVKKYLNGEIIPKFGDGSKHTCSKTVRTWVKLYEYHGEEGLSHRYHKRTIKEKEYAVNRFLAGESKANVAASLGISKSVLSGWVSLYSKGGISSIELNHLSGRPPKMSKNTPGRKTRAELEKENKYLKAEVEYLKKLDALVQKRKVQQSKKK